MDEYLDIKIKNHKVLNKKILFVEYLKPDLKFDISVTKMLIAEYLEILKEQDRVILIVDLRNLKSFDKKTIWEGAGELKINDRFFLEHIISSYIISENLLLNNLVNIVLKVMNNNIPTLLVKDINSALTDLSNQSK